MDYHKILTLEPLKGTFLVNGVLAELTEEFRDIPDYEGYYQASTFGRVKSLERKIWMQLKNSFATKKERILRQHLNSVNGGYNTIKLYKEGERKGFKVYVLVAMAFLNHKPDGTNKIVVDHKDNIRTNDYLSNLQLISNRENNSKDKWRQGGSSQYVGVCWDKSNNKWKSAIRINGKKKNLGSFTNELEASNAYQLVLKKIL